MIETILHRDHWDVDLRLHHMALSRVKLLAVVQVARTEALNATTPYHAANAAGTLSYQNGVWALRYHFVGPDWEIDTIEGVETIRNDKLRLRVGFQNVDRACDDDHVPQPRSSKGAGSERACSTGLFGVLPSFAPRPEDNDWAFYYLMVDGEGWAELTRPVIKNGIFSSAIERIYLVHGTDGDDMKLLDDDTDIIKNFDPKIERKA